MVPAQGYPRAGKQRLTLEELNDASGRWFVDAGGLSGNGVGRPDMLLNPDLMVSSRHRFCLAVAAALGGSLLSAAPADEPALELPKYTVTGTPDLPPPESWRYAEFPGFAVLSNASDAKTRQIIGNFELFRLAVSIVWPLPDKTSVPVSIIVCGARDSFDAFVPKVRRGRPELLSMFLRDAEHGAIVIDAQTAAIFSDEPTGAPNEDRVGYEVEPANLLEREYIRFLLSRKGEVLPVWMEEGMIQILLAMKVRREQIVFGRVEDPTLLGSREFPASESEAAVNYGTAGSPIDYPRYPVEDRDFNYVFRRRALIPLEQFFAVTRDSPEASRTLGDNRWVKQAYAFVHLCLFGRGGRFQKPFAAFLQRASQGPVSEAMFQECFGMNYREMQVELRLYMSSTEHQSREFNFKKGKELPAPVPLTFRDAEEFESARIKGDALLLGGQLELAEAVLLPAYLRGSRDPALLATLGLYERAAGHEDRARKFLEAAVTRKVVRPEAYLELARLRYADALAQPAEEGRFSAGQVTGITQLLYVARHQPPHLPQLYELLAETWQHSHATIGREDALILIQGATLFPDRLDYVAQVAAFALTAGIYDAAKSLIEHGLSHATEPRLRERFEHLKAVLPAG
jgi:hypothetical protein